MTENCERYLLDALSKGDKIAFEELFITYYPKVKRFLSGFIDSEEDGEDLAQDVFVKLWRSRLSLAYVENLNSYIFRIAKNTLYDFIDNSKKIYFSSEDVLPDIQSDESVEELLFADELSELINIKINRMPPQRRAIFIMSRNDGLSNQEIAEQLNISKRTVETHISAALADIRKVLPLLLIFF